MDSLTNGELKVLADSWGRAKPQANRQSRRPDRIDRKRAI